MLSKAFFKRNSVIVAKDLIGKFLVIKNEKGIHRLKITETEAYDGEKDLACHACKGRTKRTEGLYAEAGTLYIYLIYGIYWMLNVVCDEKDYPSAVLIRGVEGISGPGRLTKALGIHKGLHGSVAQKKIGLWFEDRGEKPQKILATPRIGVDFAGPTWAKKKYRFFAK